MIKLTPELKSQIEKSGKRLIPITLEDLAKAKPCSSLGIFIKK